VLRIAINIREEIDYMRFLLFELIIKKEEKFKQTILNSIIFAMKMVTAGIHRRTSSAWTEVSQRWFPGCFVEEPGMELACITHRFGGYISLL
jgi:hypothetical protein